MRSTISAFFVLWTGLLCPGCQRGPQLVVTVSSIPPATTSLRAIVTNKSQPGQPAQPSTPPWLDFPMKDQIGSPQTGLGLYLPAGFRGQIGVDVEARAGCVLATESGTVDVRSEEPEMSLTLQPTGICNLNAGDALQLYHLTPPAVSTLGQDVAGQQVTLKLSGSAFEPGTTVHLEQGALRKEATGVSLVTRGSLEVQAPEFHGSPGKVQVAVRTAKTTASLVDMLSLFFGQLKFSLLMSQPLVNGVDPGNSLSALASADMDSDGLPDLLVIHQFLPQVQVLRNLNGTSFSRSSIVITDNKPRAIAVADFNGDGKTDVALTNRGPFAVSIYLNNSAGPGSLQLAKPTSHMLLQDPLSLTVGDFDGDGRADIAVVGATNPGTVSVLLNRTAANATDAKFDPPVSNGPFQTPTFITAANLNQDSLADLIVLNQGDRTVRLLIGNGDKSFRPTSVQMRSAPVAAAAGHLNPEQDAFLDIAVASDAGVDVLLNGQGQGQFTATHYDLPAPVTALAIHDLNRDGLPDLLLGLFDKRVGVLLNPGRGDFTAARLIPLLTGGEVGNPRSLLVADLDGSGADRPDLSLIYWDRGDVQVFKNGSD